MERLLAPTRQEIVRRLIDGTAALELTKSQFRRLPPTDGVHGAFRLEGNSLPQFSYLVFDEKLMEFVAVRAQVARPDKITFESRTDDLGSVPTKADYEVPFHELTRHLFNYFPLIAEHEDSPNAKF